MDDRKLGQKMSDKMGLKYIKVYRAVKKGVDEFLDKDYVTFSERFAKEHAENNHVYHDEPYDVIFALIPSNKLHDAYNPGEYFYVGKPLKGKIIYTSLGPDEFEGFDENYSIMKESLRKAIRFLINEAMQSKHYTTRVFDRLVNLSQINVGYEISGTYGEYTEVGTYALPLDLKSRIIENTKIIENYNFPRNKSYAIKISDISIDLNKINYSSDLYKQYVLKNKPTLLFLDSYTNSNGNQLYAIIRDNKITTAFFGKSYSMHNIQQKMNVDVFIKNMDTIIQKKVH